MSFRTAVMEMREIYLKIKWGASEDGPSFLGTGWGKNQTHCPSSLRCKHWLLVHLWQWNTVWACVRALLFLGGTLPLVQLLWSDGETCRVGRHFLIHPTSAWFSTCLFQTKTQVLVSQFSFKRQSRFVCGWKEWAEVKLTSSCWYKERKVKSFFKNKKQEPVSSRGMRKAKWMKMIEIHYVHIWKCQNETPYYV